MKIDIDPHAFAHLLDILENIARQLEKGIPPSDVAKQLRDYIAKTQKTS